MRYSLSVLLLVAIALLPGCGDSIPEGDLTFVSSADHNTLDPQKMSWADDFRIIDQTFETLVRIDYNDDMSIQPAAAESWDVSEDGLVYTFQLREDAQWSNGDPLVAADFIFAWRRGMMPDHAAQYSTLFDSIVGAQGFYQLRERQLEDYARIAARSGDGGGSADAAGAMWQSAEREFADMVGLTAPNPKTLRVELARPVPYFLELVAFATFAPNHRASVESATDLVPSTGMRRTDEAYWSDPDRVVSNGPYFIADRQFRRFFELHANDNWHGRSTMKNESIVERIIPSVDIALQQYQQGQIDWLPSVPAGEPIAAQLVSQDRPDVHTQAMAGTYFYNFNCAPTLPGGRENPLADPRVRRAMSMAIDRQTLVDRVTRLSQPVAQTYIPPGSIAGYEPPAEAGVSFDPDRARELLAEAGHPEGQGLNGLSILYNTAGGHESMAQAVAQMWQQHLGVSVSLEAQEKLTFGERLRNQNYTIARGSWFGDYPDPTTFLDKMRSGSGNNDPAWSNAEYDQLMDQAADEMDSQRRMELLQQAEAVLLRDQPMALIYQYRMVMLWDPDRVTGLTPGPWNDYNLWQVAVEDPE